MSDMLDVDLQLVWSRSNAVVPYCGCLLGKEELDAAARGAFGGGSCLAGWWMYVSDMQLRILGLPSTLTDRIDDDHRMHQ